MVRVSYQDCDILVAPINVKEQEQSDTHGFIACSESAEKFLFAHASKQGDSRILRTAFGLTYYDTRAAFIPELQKQGFKIDYGHI